jgi:hypothetical protein
LQLKARMANPRNKWWPYWQTVGLLVIAAFSQQRARAAIVVAASDSSPQEKSRADFVCEGRDDQDKIAAAIALGKRGKTLVDVNPKEQTTVECVLNHVVELLPGNYQLTASIELPDAADCAFRGEGSTLHYLPKQGDCVVIRGMNRCRYSFGTIQTNSTGAAIHVQPKVGMPSLMSFVTFTGLVGPGTEGTGLYVDPSYENVCVNRFEGTDVLKFKRGVYVGGAGARDKSTSTQGKADTNWFWLSYVRMCSTCIEESATGVDSGVWEVNVDASLPGSTAIKAAGAYDKWFIIMGTYTHEKKNLALVLEPGARHSVFEIQPPIEEFASEDRSGTNTNVIVSRQKEKNDQASGGLPSKSKRAPGD